MNEIHLKGLRLLKFASLSLDEPDVKEFFSKIIEKEMMRLKLLKYVTVMFQAKYFLLKFIYSSFLL